MSKILTPNQLQKVDRPYLQPIYLCKLMPTGLTLYFSDRNFTLVAQNYEDYLYDLSNIGNEIRNLGGYDNSQLTLRFKNEKIGNKAPPYDYLIQLFDDYPIEKKYLEIYKLNIDTGETFGSDVSTKIYKGEMGQPYDLDELAFQIDCSSMLFGKNASLPLDQINITDYPNCDPDDVGKYRNILYGDLKKVICPWTVAGWVSTLTANITLSDLSIVVTGEYGHIPIPTAPFTMICDNEQIRVTVKTGNTLTVTRGYGGTIATTHNKGATVYESRADFEAEVAQHPVKAITNVYGKKSGSSVWVRAISGYTAYISSGGRAKIVFTDKVKWEEAIDEDLTPGTHAHTYSISSSTEVAGTGGGYGPIYDGSIDTKSDLTGSDSCILTFAGVTEYGTVVRQYANVVITPGVTGVSYVQVTVDGVGYQIAPTYTKLTMKIPFGSVDWDASITVSRVGGAGDTTYVWEVWKTVEYIPTPMSNTAISMSGNSVANMFVADQIAVDCEGYADPDGNYGGIGTTIVNPAFIRKHILVQLLNFSLSDIDASFGTVATTYAGRIAGGYKLGFVLHEVATETMDLFCKLDEQTRSNMFESAGVFKLVFNTVGIAPTSLMDFYSDNISGTFKFSKTEVSDIRNLLRGHYNRDYSKSGSLGDMYQGVRETSDAGSITKYGTMQEDIEFSAIGDLSTMVDDVLLFHIALKHELLKKVKFDAYWDAAILESCDFFHVNSNFWANDFKTLNVIENPSDQKIYIEGLEWV